MSAYKDVLINNRNTLCRIAHSPEEREKNEKRKKIGGARRIKRKVLGLERMTGKLAGRVVVWGGDCDHEAIGRESIRSVVTSAAFSYSLHFCGNPPTRLLIHLKKEKNENRKEKRKRKTEGAEELRGRFFGTGKIDGEMGWEVGGGVEIVTTKRLAVKAFDLWSHLPHLAIRSISVDSLLPPMIA
ncbi:hypothetical protein CEXT_475251 [Caerostris extrusa]|uniref:Uncharacterized protein n=1 Tax=Caerostris extrusa TaxID=172846 RepID=A0AAV4SWH3_CAEEX|nr:hypothetical protein CEXT_475251 [Caerostris extrusa]